MKRLMLAGLLSLGLVALCGSQGAVTKPAPVPSYKAGGTPIAIPPPMSDMSEVGYDNREFMEVFVAPNNRLIAGFIPTIDLPKLTKKASDLNVTKYAMVQVPRRGEYMDCGASDFKEVAAGAKEQFGDVANSSMAEAEEEFNRRMKSLDLEEATVSLGKPILLGCLFSKPDEYGFGMIVPVSMAGNTVKMGVGGALVRAKKRVLFAYLYAEYKDETTVRWLRTTTEKWADAIVKANP